MIQELTLPELATPDNHSMKRGPFGGALKKNMFVANGYVVYEQQHAIYKRFNDVRYFVDESKYKELKAFKVEEGDLIISCSGTIGKIAAIPKNFKPGVINQALLKLTLDQNKVLNKYFIFLFESKEIQNQLFNLSHGTGLKNFPPMSVVKSIKFPIPPLDQQKKIAAILDAADAYRQKTKALIEKYDELTQSLFLDMFGDRNKFKRVALETVVSNKKDFVDGPFGSNLKVSDQTSYGVRLIQINNIGVGQFRDKTQKFTSEEKYQSIIKHNVKPNDIVVAKMGEPLGRACIVPDFINKGLVVADCMRIRVSLDNFSNYFVMFFLNSDDAKQQINNLSHGSTRIRINLSMLRKLEIPLPPLDLQNQFAERVQAIEAQKAQAEASLAQAEDLFNSLLQRAFKGELTT